MVNIYEAWNQRHDGLRDTNILLSFWRQKASQATMR